MFEFDGIFIRVMEELSGAGVPIVLKGAMVQYC